MIATETSVALADGTRVSLHPMEARDAAALLVFHDALSLESTYLRFFSIHPALSNKELHRFTHVDHDAREALVAAVAGRIVGIARFDQIDETGDAEVAFVVADSWQGRGLGTALFQALADRARAVGVQRLVAETLPQNQRMLSVFRHAGLPAELHLEDGLVRVALDLGSEV